MSKSRLSAVRPHAPALALAVALAAVAFAGAGGSELGRATVVEIALTLAGGLAVALALLVARGGRLDGGGTVVAFAALAALTALSIAWSIVPDLSWLEANRTLSYLAAFAAAAALGRMAPNAYTVVLRAILLAAFAVCAYALSSRIWPATLSPMEIYARLEQPFAYWNALGATAALAVPPALWLGTRRSGYRPANALAFPLLTILTITLFLSYSRGALAFAALSALAWLAVVPLRLRTIMLLAVALAGAAPIVIWALARDAFTKNYVPLSVRESVSTQFGLFLLATVIVVLAAGLAIGFRFGRRAPRARMRFAAGLTAAAVACAVPVVLGVVLASSDRGISGTISADFESLTSARGTTPGGPGRLATATNSRGLYWHQAMRVFDDNELHGTGAGTFGVARLRYRHDKLVARHAHGYLQQTLSDLGVVGLTVTALLAIAWLASAVRATALTLRRRRRLPYGSDRVALIALALCAVVYGLHSALDWIWFVPGPTVMALVAAGFVAGRGPLRLRLRAAVAAPARVAALERAAVAAREPVTVGAGAGWSGPAGDVGHGDGAAAGNGTGPGRNGDGLDPDAITTVLSTLRERVGGRLRFDRRLAARARGAAAAAERHARPLLAAATIVVAAVCAWAFWQPLRSDSASDDALAAAAHARWTQALRLASDARRYDPLTPRPLIVRASIENSKGDRVAAERDMRRAVADFHLDPQVWLQLAEYQLTTLGQPAAALQTARGALALDPQSYEAQTVYLDATARLNPAEAPPPSALTPPAPGAPAAPPSSSTG